MTATGLLDWVSGLDDCGGNIFPWMVMSASSSSSSYSLSCFLLFSEDRSSSTAYALETICWEDFSSDVYVAHILLTH